MVVDGQKLKSNFSSEKDNKDLVVSKRVLKSDKYFPIEVASRMIQLADNIRDKFYLAWHFETGVRVSDIVGQVDKKGSGRLLGQEIHNIDWDNNRVWTYDHKKDSWRYVYFPKKVRGLLKIWLKERQNLGFKSRQLFPYSEKTCNRIVKRWAKEAGFQYAVICGTHWCRHTFIRLSRRVGRDIKAVQQNTGDTIPTLLNWYADLGTEEMHIEVDEKPIFGELNY